MQELLDRGVLRIATRGSNLSMVQSRWVASMISQRYPHVSIEFVVVRTKGDRDSRSPFTGFREKGVFVKDIQRAILDGRADIAVHSLKDLPTDQENALQVIAVPEREDPRDALISASGLALKQLPNGSIVGTSSPRRKAQLLSSRGDLQVVPLRGNVDTRMKRLQQGKVDAIVVAMAGLKRLGMEDAVTEVLPEGEFLPAVGQGALAIEGLREDLSLAEGLAFLDHWPTHQAVEAERALLRALGGGCQIPLGALAVCNGNRIRMTAMVCDVEGGRMILEKMEGPTDEPTFIGEAMAERLIQRGALQLMGGNV